jgi:hypothetical protein
VSMEGRRLACRGVLLIPDSPGVAAQIARVFGNTERGTRLVGEREAMRRARRDRDVELVAGARESRCGYYVRSFEFEDVPPGDYYVTAYFAPGMAMGDPANGMIPTGLDLMRRITVPAGRRAEVSFVHR